LKVTANCVYLPVTQLRDFLKHAGRQFICRLRLLSPPFVFSEPPYDVLRTFSVQKEESQ
jgi:hypothetical protein